MYVKKLVHHPEIIGLMTTILMVFIMSNYNLVWRYGFGNHHLKHEMVIYPISLVLVFLVKTYISLPLVKYLHKQVNWLKNRPRHISMPFLVISSNTLIVIAVMTFLFKNYLPSHYFADYLRNWMRSFIVAIPVFFFVVRPIVTKIIGWLRTKITAPNIL